MLLPVKFVVWGGGRGEGGREGGGREVLEEGGGREGNLTSCAYL